MKKLKEMWVKEYIKVKSFKNPFDNYTGYKFSGTMSVDGPGDLKGVEKEVPVHNHLSGEDDLLTLSTGRVGQYKNDKIAGDFIARPMSVKDGIFGLTKELKFDDE